MRGCRTSSLQRAFSGRRPLPTARRRHYCSSTLPRGCDDAWSPAYRQGALAQGQPLQRFSKLSTVADGVLIANERLPIRQGGLLHIDFTEPALADVHVTTDWVDECLVQIYGDYPGTLYDHGVTVRVDEDEGVISIRRNGDGGSSASSTGGSSSSSDSDSAAGDETPCFRIVATLPQSFNVMVRVAAGSIITGSTIEGDVTLSTGSGDIQIRKVQGHSITLFAPRGAVAAKEAEGNVHIRAGTDVDAVLLSGQNILVEQGPSALRDYDALGGGGSGRRKTDSSVAAAMAAAASLAGEVRIGGLYAEQAVVRCAGAASISTSHGRLVLDSGVGGSSGTGSSSSGGGPVRITGVNGCAVVSAATGPVSVQFDALAPGSLSRVLCDEGDVAVSVAEDVATAVSVGSGRMPEVLSPRFEGDVAARGATGWLRPLPQRRRLFGGSGSDSASVGKISLDGAREQRLDAFLGGVDGTKDDGETGEEPRIEVLAPAGTVRIKTLSWMDMIKQKHLAK